MSTVESKLIRIYPACSEDRALVQAELEELAGNTHFSGSKRYPALLRYVVEKALSGQAGELKERTIGIDVFHRSPDYDTNNDTVVRVTAGEVRKRLALTYHESGHRHSLQILLPAGSYIPEFYQHPAPLETQSTPEIADQSPHGVYVSMNLAVPLADPDRSRASGGNLRDTGLSRERMAQEPLQQLTTRRMRKLLLNILFVLVGVLIGSLLAPVRAYLVPNSVSRFWRPFEAGGAPVLFCAGSLVPTTAATGFTEAGKNDDYPYISVATAEALAAVGNQLTSHRIDYFVQPCSSSTLTDMRQHPTLLVGAYNNKWTIMMLKELRFRFTDKPISEIYDSRNSARVWKRADALPYKDKDDYAIVARFHSKTTDNEMVAIAGLGKNGTEAAAQFVTSPRFLDLLDRQFGRGWSSKNIEIVLRTAVVDSKTGTPSIEAVEIW